MGSEDSDLERRRERRQQVKITVLLKAGVLISGRGITKDISEHGLSIMAPQIFKSMSSSQSKDFTGAALRVMIPNEALTINGRIAWVDLKKGEGAITILSTSDDDRWKEICQSIRQT
jgi:hypothetical protein